jgi:hypothetical protein
MRTLIAACVAGGLAGCAALSGNVDDNGRVFRETANAPIDANLEPLAAEPSIQILSDRLPGRRDPESARSAGEPASACEAERYQSLIGMTATDVERQRLPETSRMLEYGSVYTQDYVPARLNVHLDQNGRVYRVICG